MSKKRFFFMLLYIMANIYKENLIFLSQISKNDLIQIQNDKLKINDKWFVSLGGYNLRGDNTEVIESIIEKSFFQVLTELELILTNSNDSNLEDSDWRDELKETFTVNLSIIKKALDNLSMLSVSGQDYKNLDKIASKVQKALSKLELIFNKNGKDTDSSSDLETESETEVEGDSDSETQNEDCNKKFNINNIITYISDYVFWAYGYLWNFFSK